MTGGLTHHQAFAKCATDERRRHVPARLHARIIFVKAIPGGLLIDALCRPYGTLTSATAVSLEAALPYRTWAYLAGAALDRWAVEGAEVTVKFRHRDSVLQASMSDRHRSVLLDLRRWPAGSAEPIVQL